MAEAEKTSNFPAESTNKVLISSSLQLQVPLFHMARAKLKPYQNPGTSRAVRTLRTSFLPCIAAPSSLWLCLPKEEGSRVKAKILSLLGPMLAVRNPPVPRFPTVSPLLRSGAIVYSDGRDISTTSCEEKDALSWLSLTKHLQRENILLSDC